MEHLIINNTNIEVSQFCLGTAYFGTKINKKDSFRMLDSFIDQNGNFIDTALIYAYWIKGSSLSEKLIGEYISINNIRETIVICTKGFIKKNPEEKIKTGQIKNDLENSLINLKTNYIDLYLLHKDYIEIPVKEIIDILYSLKSMGKIRHYGLSNWNINRFKQAYEYSLQNYNYRIPVNQLHWNIAKVNINYLNPHENIIMDDEFYNFQLSNKITTMAYTPSAGGVFQKMNTNNLNPDDILYKTYYNKNTQKIFSLIKQLTLKYDTNISSIILNYLLNHDFQTIPIIGCSTIEQLNENINIERINFSKKEIEKTHNLKTKKIFFNFIV